MEQETIEEIDLEEILSEEESISKLKKACEGCEGDDACCAITGLRRAGWRIDRYESKSGFWVAFKRPVAQRGQQ